jgi:predicted dehydrogenase
LLGCGWIAELAHVPTLKRSLTGRLVAALDTDPVRQAWMRAEVPGVRLHDHWDALLHDPGVDAIVVALPTGLHADAAVQAFGAGKHVFVEKPLASTMDEGQRVLEAWRGAGTAGGVGYNFRRNPIFEAAARTLHSGEMGALVAIQASFQWAAEEVRGWRAKPEEGGGVLLDLVSHQVDMVLALTGEPIAACQCTIRSLRTPEDTASVHLVTKSGVTAQLHASFAAGAHVNRLDLTGGGGVLAVDLLDGHPRRVVRRPGRGARLQRGLIALEQLHPRRLLRAPGAEPSFRSTLEAFLTCVRDGRAAIPDLADGFRALAVVDAARASARSGSGMVPVESVD